jgi:hypothetical protein
MNPTRNWPNKKVAAHKFNDPIIDDMTDFDYYARAAYIEDKISRNDYLSIERARQSIVKELSLMSEKGKKYFREVLSGV